MFYIPRDQALHIHKVTVEVSGGGATGILDFGKLEAVLEHIQNDDYYPNFADKLNHLFFCTCQFHSFEDGNKRLAISLSAQLLLLNGYVWLVPEFIKNMENISYHVASGKINKDLLHEIIEAILNDDFENENIKFKIYKALT
ncbi:MAG: type II toxin-antitoxin system death-on-curing family toxin [Clostridia bacterium]|nr:type II toxin-antitoxin system death-on-curing family toxin [Clostridia bacterium]MDD4375802.1 type II toxin-antitoxin system death-on-curing family toxin [Clostridia bacterium]